jgi:dihydroflavonol-4-reductase
VRAHTVFVSGATGFIASHIIQQLLDSGHRVRGSVRNLRKTEDLAFLRDLSGAADRLELVEADLLKPRAFQGQLDGCDLVMHTASPYVLDVRDPQRDLVDPAVRGTRSMLEACAGTTGITRVILTSSMAAVTDEPDERRVLTENDWNTKSTLTRNPYYLSKTLAEREAWAFVDAQRPAWKLIVINPFMVIGPSLSKALNTSNKVIADLLNGVYPAIPGLAWGAADVRDVALAHLRAMDAPDAHGRYICAAETVSARHITTLLRTHGYAGYRLPRINLDHPVGHRLARLAAYMQSRGARQYLQTHVGRVPRFDNSKGRRDLSLTYRPIDQTILEAAADLVRWGHASPRPA